MKILKLFTLILVLCIFQSVQFFAQSQGNDVRTIKGKIPIVREPNPCASLKKNEDQLDVLKASNNGIRPSLKEGSSRTGELEKLGIDEQLVSMFVMTTLGPIGKAFTRNDFGEYIKLPEEKDPKRKNPFIYPSLYFDISASPLLVGVTGDNEDIFALNEVKNQKNEMMWMDITFELFPYCKSSDKSSDKYVACSCDEAKFSYCKEPQLKIISILPNETVSGTRDSIPGQIAGAASELATLSQPFYASSTFGVKSEAASKGVTVLFNNLFPPKPFTYQHAYISSASRFGWNFHNQSRLKDSKSASIMGLHRAAAVLQVREDVQLIGVRYYSLSEWNKPPNTHSNKYDLRSDGICIGLPEKQEEEKTSYEKLSNIDKFPLLIPKAEVCKIFQVADGESCSKLIKYITGYNSDGSIRKDLINADGTMKTEKLVEMTPDSNFIIKTSLEKYLGIQKKEEKKEEEKPKTK